MDDLEPLLAVQALDTHVDQLEHRKANLEERAELERVREELASLDEQLAAVGEQRHGVARSQRQLEDEVAMVEQKAAEVNHILYSGAVKSPRELQTLQDEVESLRRRQGQLEDKVLELMEEAEPVDAQLAALESHRAKAAAEETRLAGAVDEVEAAIDAEIGSLAAERATAVEGIAGPLLSEYDTLRARLGGVAVARLVGNRCDGCHLTLPAVEVDRIRHDRLDELVHCSQCERLLVP